MQGQNEAMREELLRAEQHVSELEANKQESARLRTSLEQLKSPRLEIPRRRPEAVDAPGVSAVDALKDSSPGGRVSRP